MKYHLRYYPILFITILLACSASYKKYKAHYFAMDTVVEVTLFAKSKRTAKNAVDKMIKESQRIEKLFSAFTPGSEVKKINERKSRARIVVDYEVLSVIKTALEYGKETEGLFDITIGPVKWLWGFSAHQKPRVPPDSQIQALLTHVDYSKISIHGDTLIFKDPAIQIDLGGISKGYALKKLAQVMENCGITSYMLNAGGDIVCGDRKPDGGDWIIGVQHPRKKGEIYKTVKLSNTCIVTSGDYERFFMHGSMRYHHIFDPRTGYPAQGIISASVICDDIVRADVVSTTLVVGGKDMVKKEWLGVEQVLLLDDDMAEVSFSHTETQRHRDMD